MDSIKVEDLSDAQLFMQLLQYDPNTGPVTDATRSVYRRKLIRFTSNGVPKASKKIEKKTENQISDAKIKNAEFRSIVPDTQYAPLNRADRSPNISTNSYLSHQIEEFGDSFTSNHFQGYDDELPSEKLNTIYNTSNSFEYIRTEAPEIRKRETSYLTSSYEDFSRDSKYPSVYSDGVKSPYSRPALNSVNHSFNSAPYDSMAAPNALVKNSEQRGLSGKLLIAVMLGLIVFGYIVYASMESAHGQIE